MQASEQRAADADHVPAFVGETAAGMITVFGGGEQGTEKQHKTIRVLVIGVERLACQVLRVAADLAHGAGAVQAIAILALYLKIDHAIPYIIQAEVFVKQANERPDGAGGVVVLGLAQQQRTAAFDVHAG